MLALGYNMVMLFEFVRWWYGPGWLDATARARDLIVSTQKAFSAGVLLRTLFSPWKQIVTLPGRSLSDRFKAGIDNLVSRVVGFFARLITLLAATILISLMAFLGFISVVVWPVLPVAFGYFIFRSITG